MNSPSELPGISKGLPLGTGTKYPPAGSQDAAVETHVLLEFRSLSDEDVETLGVDSATAAFKGKETIRDPLVRDSSARDATEAARLDGFKAGEREGHRVAQAEMEAQAQARTARERERLLAVVEDFGAARQRYFADVEQEVVKLSLAIAARVLHREAQMDGLLLAAAVRVALEKVAHRSGVILRSPGADVGAWERMFEAAEPSERPRVVADAHLGRGDCVLETEVGTVALGVSVQLEEIEKGFFDLLNHRPGR